VNFHHAGEHQWSMGCGCRGHGKLSCLATKRQCIAFSSTVKCWHACIDAGHAVDHAVTCVPLTSARRHAYFELHLHTAMRSPYDLGHSAFEASTHIQHDRVRAVSARGPILTDKLTHCLTTAAPSQSQRALRCHAWMATADALVLHAHVCSWTPYVSAFTPPCTCGHLRAVWLAACMGETDTLQHHVFE
jgi:hypothetical protein